MNLVLHGRLQRPVQRFLLMQNIIRNQHRIVPAVMYIYKFMRNFVRQESTKEIVNTSQFSKTIFYFLSPFIIWTLFCLIGFIIDKFRFSGDTREWSHLVAGLFFPSFFVFVPVDLLLRLITRNKTGRIWIAELILMLCLVIVFYVWLS